MVTVSSCGLNVGSKITCTPGVTHIFGSNSSFHVGLNFPGAAQTLGGTGEIVFAGTNTAGANYEAQWRSEIQPHSADYDHFRLLLDLYRALRRVGADVDVIGRDAPLAGYRLVLVPGLEHVDDALAGRLAAFEGVLLIGPRTGARTEGYSIAPELLPGPLGDLAGVRVTRVDSLPRTRAEPLEWRGRGYTASVWREEARFR